MDEVANSVLTGFAFLYGGLYIYLVARYFHGNGGYWSK